MKIMETIDRILSAAGLPCRTCRGRGYVIDSDVAEFIARNGLAAFQGADTLMVNETDYGGLGSIPVGTWQEVGLSEDQAELFATDVGHVHKIHSCPTCKGQKDHPSPLRAATEIIDRLRADDRRRRSEWLRQRTPEDRRLLRLRRMASAIRYAKTERGYHEFDHEAAE